MHRLHEEIEVIVARPGRGDPVSERKLHVSAKSLAKAKRYEAWLKGLTKGLAAFAGELDSFSSEVGELNGVDWKAVSAGAKEASSAITKAAHASQRKGMTPSALSLLSRP